MPEDLERKLRATSQLEMEQILRTCYYPDIRDTVSAFIRGQFVIYLQREERAQYMRTLSAGQVEKIVTTDGKRSVLSFRQR